ncbi:GDP-fucose protein O-fucosyltransferase [Artemisia annua]|uniref:O-fucosyltransferase family protein n=1 Tax=Artemisia annua TaxID=35608 RepID=A0A2U1M602_ARTAN|nr:GDP-fucose protein O-fucosyltransferase [Artemisia annua]
MDFRQIVAGMLTVTMFLMLAHMIKRDHFDPPPHHHLHVNHAGRLDNSYSEQNFALGNDGQLWKPDDLTNVVLKPCWSKPVLEEEGSRGFVSFSLTNGPEYHISQIANAVVVARYLRATLIIPDIRGTQPGDWRNFGDIYDIEKFVNSLNGVVKVVKTQPSELSAKNLAVLRVPNRVTEDYIADNIEPAFKSKGNVRLATYFPSVNMKKSDDDWNSVNCLAMYGALELQPDVQQVVDSMVKRLKSLSLKSNGPFVAVDLRLDMLDKKGCQDINNGDVGGSKKCYTPLEVALFLKKLGFDKDTVIYLTQSRWDSSLDAIKDLFPKSFTKEGLMPMDKTSKFLESEEYEKVIDFYLSSESDVFVPAISGLFYANVAGKRIASGKTQILVPANIPPASSASVTNYVSQYVSKKSHMAYSCFC